MNTIIGEIFKTSHIIYRIMTVFPLLAMVPIIGLSLYGSYLDREQCAPMFMLQLWIQATVNVISIAFFFIWQRKEILKVAFNVIDARELSVVRAGQTYNDSMFVSEGRRSRPSSFKIPFVAQFVVVSATFILPLVGEVVVERACAGTIHGHNFFAVVPTMIAGPFFCAVFMLFSWIFQWTTFVLGIKERLLNRTQQRDEGITPE